MAFALNVFEGLLTSHFHSWKDILKHTFVHLPKTSERILEHLILWSDQETMWSVFSKVGNKDSVLLAISQQSNHLQVKILSNFK